MSSSGINLEKYLIPLDEIIRATKNFSRERRIGDGGFGSVYKGQLSERWQNQAVAVKRLDADSRQGDREFRNELEVISRFCHENIITFIGYCDEGVEMIIVYEYALNGSLDHHLRDPNKMSNITWAQRLDICIGAARGLRHLHSGLGEKNKVIHRDVKSANILLDGNMVAKICDFGLSKMGTRNQPDTRLYTKVAGTQFYLDPTYLESGILQRESDIYSFGVVLFEILSGMLAYHERRYGDEGQSLIKIVRRYNQTEPDKLIDPCIRQQIKSSSFEIFKEIAYGCISLTSNERPALDTVIEKLEEALMIQISSHSVWTPVSNPVSYPADHLIIESLIGKLNSVSPYDQWIASSEIRLRTNRWKQNLVAFGQAGAIPALIPLLTAPNSQTQVNSMTALFNLSIDDDNNNKDIIFSSGAVPGIVHVLKNGNNLARENAAGAIYMLSKVMREESSVIIGSTGVIPPLSLLLSEGTMRGKHKAANALIYLCIFNDNKGRAVRAGLVPILMDLLTEPHGVLKEKSVALLATLSKCPEGSLAIGEAQAVAHLVDVIGSGSQSCDGDAVTVLDELCSMDEKYLVEAQEHGVIEKLKDLRHHGTSWDRTKVQWLRRKIKDHQQVDYGSDTEDVVWSVESNMRGMLEPDPTDSRLIANAKRGALKITQIFYKITNIHL